MVLFMALAWTGTYAFSVLPIALKTGSVKTTAFTSKLGLFEMFNKGKKALVRSLAGDYDQATIRARLDGLIKENPVLVLTFETCPYCVKAKAILDAKQCKYTEVDLTKDPDGKALRAEMGEIVGRTSVPAIWIDAIFIGGCNDGPMGGVSTLNDSGELDRMLSAVSAI